MTDGGHIPPRIVLVGVDENGADVARLPLGHGDAPGGLLAAQGWAVDRVIDVVSRTGDGAALTVTFGVAPLQTPTDRPATDAVRRDDGLVVVEGEVPARVQRVAAYAVVTSERGVLMTELSERTSRPGQWGLPGGGIDDGEDPREAVARECWEESGQHVAVADLALVQTSHWIGRAPSGRLEDFHAVRLVFAASCEVPTDPVVHDVGGTTASASWSALDRVGQLPLTTGWRAALSEIGLVAGPAR